MRIKKVPCLAWIVGPVDVEWKNKVVTVLERSPDHKQTGLPSWYIEPTKGLRVVDRNNGQEVHCSGLAPVVVPDAYLTPINDPDVDVGDVGEEKAWTLKDVLEKENV